MVSWEIDLFGRVGTASAVAQRQADAAAATAHSAEALLQAEVVRHYVLLRLYQHDLARLHEESDVLQRRHTLLQARERAGLADRREDLAAQAQREQAQATIAQTQAALHGTRAALAVLAGRAPATAEADSTWQALLAPQTTSGVALPAVPDTTGVVQPTDLLARRPDVARADAQLRAALGETVLADRAHLPRLSLNLSAGLNVPLRRPGPGQRSALRRGPRPAMGLAGRRPQPRPRRRRQGGRRSGLAPVGEHRAAGPGHSESALRGWGAARTAWQHATQAESAAQRAAQHAQKRFDTGL